MKYYIVGLDGNQTPDPDYWWDRAECIKADNEGDAVRDYIEKSSWLRDDEEKFVEVLGVEDESVYAPGWCRDRFGGDM